MSKSLFATDAEFLSEEQARALTLRVLSFAKADETRVNVTSGAAAMLETVRLLDAAGLTPTTMMLREPTLDDVFLELTGARLEGDEERHDHDDHDDHDDHQNRQHEAALAGEARS